MTSSITRSGSTFGALKIRVCLSELCSGGGTLARSVRLCENMWLRLYGYRESVGAFCATILFSVRFSGNLISAFFH